MAGHASPARAVAAAAGPGADGAEAAAGTRAGAARTAHGPRISVVIPTLDAGPGFRHLCRHLQRVRDRYDLEVLVIDSGSRDSTPDEAERAGFRVHRIDPAAFGHGRTRNLGVRMTSGDVICFLTQDVLPCTPDWPARFAAMLAAPGVAGVYGRQVPRDASTMEMFFVAVNYPPEPLRYGPVPGIAGDGEPCRRSGGARPDGSRLPRELVRAATPRPGRVLFSNAFSAVRRDVVLRIPFREDVPVSEDQVWAIEALAAGYTIAYEPAAEALHAHRYTLRGLFRRTYLIARALRQVGLDRGASLPESVRFLATELRYIIRQGHVHRLPGLLAYEFVRWAGFHAGRRGA
ncbi:MAG TPA: glycosyltransferase family 2 protein [Longimicrobiales bacterium]